MARVLALMSLAALTVTLGSFAGDGAPSPIDTSRAALTNLGQEYGDLQLWASAIAATTDTLPSTNSERARVLAHQLARLMGPLEEDFENTTAALSTAQLELILPLWERMAFAHAGFAMLQEEALALGGDPMLEPAELHDLADELSAVLDFASEIQRLLLTQLTNPGPSPARLT